MIDALLVAATLVEGGKGDQHARAYSMHTALRIVRYHLYHFVDTMVLLRGSIGTQRVSATEEPHHVLACTSATDSTSTLKLPGRTFTPHVFPTPKQLKTAPLLRLPSTSPPGMQPA